MLPPGPPPSPGAGYDGGLSIGTLPGRTGLRLAGAVDMASLARLRAAVAALPAGGDAVHLDLSELFFIDVAGTRELVAITRLTPPRRLILHDPPMCLRRILGLLWPGGLVEIRVSRYRQLPPDGQHYAAWGMN